MSSIASRFDTLSGKFPFLSTNEKQAAIDEVIGTLTRLAYFDWAIDPPLHFHCFLSVLQINPEERGRVDRIVQKVFHSAVKVEGQELSSPLFDEAAPFESIRRFQERCSFLSRETSRQVFAEIQSFFCRGLHIAIPEGLVKSFETVDLPFLLALICGEKEKATLVAAIQKTTRRYYPKFGVILCSFSNAPEEYGWFSAPFFEKSTLTLSEEEPWVCKGEITSYLFLVLQEFQYPSTRPFVSGEAVLELLLYAYSWKMTHLMNKIQQWFVSHSEEAAKAIAKRLHEKKVYAALAEIEVGYLFLNLSQIQEEAGFYHLLQINIKHAVLYPSLKPTFIEMVQLSIGWDLNRLKILMQYRQDTLSGSAKEGIDEYLVFRISTLVKEEMSVPLKALLSASYKTWEGDFYYGIDRILIDGASEERAKEWITQLNQKAVLEFFEITQGINLKTKLEEGIHSYFQKVVFLESEAVFHFIEQRYQGPEAKIEMFFLCFLNIKDEAAKLSLQSFVYRNRLFIDQVSIFFALKFGDALANEKISSWLLSLAMDFDFLTQCKVRLFQIKKEYQIWLSLQKIRKELNGCIKNESLKRDDSLDARKRADFVFAVGEFLKHREKGIEDSLKKLQLLEEIEEGSPDCRAHFTLNEDIEELEQFYEDFILTGQVITKAHINRLDWGERFLKLCPFAKEDLVLQNFFLNWMFNPVVTDQEEMRKVPAASLQALRETLQGAEAKMFFQKAPELDGLREHLISQIDAYLNFSTYASVANWGAGTVASLQNGLTKLVYGDSKLTLEGDLEKLNFLMEARQIPIEGAEREKIDQKLISYLSQSAEAGLRPKLETLLSTSYKARRLNSDFNYEFDLALRRSCVAGDKQSLRLFFTREEVIRFFQLTNEIALREKIELGVKTYFEEIFLQQKRSELFSHVQKRYQKSSTKIEMFCFLLLDGEEKILLKILQSFAKGEESMSIYYECETPISIVLQLASLLKDQEMIDQLVALSMNEPFIRKYRGLIDQLVVQHQIWLSFEAMSSQLESFESEDFLERIEKFLEIYDSNRQVQIASIHFGKQVSMQKTPVEELLKEAYLFQAISTKTEGLVIDFNAEEKIKRIKDQYVALLKQKHGLQMLQIKRREIAKTFLILQKMEKSVALAEFFFDEVASLSSSQGTGKVESVPRGDLEALLQAFETSAGEKFWQDDLMKVKKEPLIEKIRAHLNGKAYYQIGIEQVAGLLPSMTDFLSETATRVRGLLSNGKTDTVGISQP